MQPFTEFYRLRAFALNADGAFSYLWYDTQRTVNYPVDRIFVHDYKATEQFQVPAVYVLRHEN